MCAVECRILSKSSDSSDVNKGTDCSAALTSSPTAAAALSFFKPFCRLKIKEEEEEEFEEEDDVVVPRENKQLVVVVVFIVVVVVVAQTRGATTSSLVTSFLSSSRREFEPRREWVF